MKSFESRHYRLAAGDAQARGTFIIIRKADDFTTLRFTCGEGWCEYKRLSHLYHFKRAAFDAACKQYDFTT